MSSSLTLRAANPGFAEILHLSRSTRDPFNTIELEDVEGIELDGVELDVDEFDIIKLDSVELDVDEFDIIELEKLEDVELDEVVPGMGTTCL